MALQTSEVLSFKKPLSDEDLDYDIVKESLLDDEDFITVIQDTLEHPYNYQCRGGYIARK